MTALERVEQAEALSQSGDDRAVVFANEAIGIEGATSQLGRPRAHRLLALSIWPKGDLRQARRHFGNLAELLGAQDEVPKAMLAETIGDAVLADYTLANTIVP